MKYAKIIEESQYKFIPRLNFDELKDITTQYGCSNDVPISTPIEDPPNPKTSIVKAGEHLIKQQKKGFFPNKEVLDASKIYQSNMIPYILKKREALTQKQVKFSSSQLSPLNSNSLAPEAETQTHSIKLQSFEPYQKFWHTSQCVNSLISEIQNFTWWDHSQLVLTKGRIHDEVSSIVRIMNSKQDINFRGKSRKQLIEIMKEFVLSIRTLRINLITAIITEGKIDLSKIPSKYKIEFNELFENTKDKPQKKFRKHHNNEEEEIDPSFIRCLEHMLQNLPKEYRMSTESIDNYLPHKIQQQSKHQIFHVDSIISAVKSKKTRPMSRTQPVSPRDIPGMPNRKTIQTHIITQPFTRQNSPREKLEQGNIPFEQEEAGLPYYWNLTDPLKETREGDNSNSLSTLSNFSKKLGFDHSKLDGNLLKVSDPFQLTTNNPEPTKEILEDVQLIDEIKPIDEPKESNLKELQEKSKKEIETFNKLYQFGLSENALQFLNNQNTEVAEDLIGVDIHQRLNEIWDDLGFSPMQKLEMVVRYSSSSDTCNKLTEALCLWEMGLSAIQSYNNMYKNLKHFVQFEFNQQTPKSFFINRENELNEQIEKIKAINSQLRKTYNDSLVLKRKDINEVFQSRRIKIIHLKHLKESEF